MKRIPTTQNKHTLVDDADYEWLSGMKWQINKSGHILYATHGIWDAKLQKVRVVRMHRLIMKPPDGLQIDHIDGNGLNNQRANLRVVTPSQNGMNSRKRNIEKSSRFKGVCFDTRVRKWRAYISINQHRKYLGYFASENEAAMAYDAACIEHYGEFAHPNFTKGR